MQRIFGEMGVADPEKGGLLIGNRLVLYAVGMGPMSFDIDPDLALKVHADYALADLPRRLRVPRRRIIL